MVPKYKSWVPTAAGRISFRLVGDGNNPTRAIWRNVAFEQSRKIVAFQRRQLNDHVFFLPAWRGEVGDFIFLCVADCQETPKNPDNPLRGEVFLFVRKTWKDKVLDVVRDTHACMSNLADPIERKNAQNVIDGHITKTYDKARKNCEAYAKFNLARDGEFSLSEIQNGLETESKFPDEQVVASQMFFFIKDIVHRHQHHDASTDTLINLYPFNERDDLHWRWQVIYSLYYQAIDGKRSTREARHGDALGIIAYADAFQKICAIHKKELPFFSREALKDSILAAQDTFRTNMSLEARASHPNSLIIFFVGVLFSVLSLVGALSDNFADSTSPPKSILFAATLIYTHLDYALGALVVFTLGGGVAFFSTPFDWRKMKLTRKILRAVQAMPQHLVGGILFLSSLLVAFLTVKLAQTLPQIISAFLGL